MKRSPLVRRTALRNRGALLRSAALTRSAPLRSSKPITVSRRLISPDEAGARRLVYARSHGVCEGCNGSPAQDWSHRKAASQGGPWCASNGLALCRSCHSWAHAHPVEAYRIGWHVRSGHDHQTTPVLIHRLGWVLLRPTGEFTPTERTAA